MNFSYRFRSLAQHQLNKSILIQTVKSIADRRLRTRKTARSPRTWWRRWKLSARLTRCPVTSCAPTRTSASSRTGFAVGFWLFFVGDNLEDFIPFRRRRRLQRLHRRNALRSEDKLLRRSVRVSQRTLRAARVDVRWVERRKSFIGLSTFIDSFQTATTTAETTRMRPTAPDRKSHWGKLDFHSSSGAKPLERGRPNTKKKVLHRGSSGREVFR